MGWQAKSFLYWPETAGCALQTIQTLQTFQTLGKLPNWLLELPNYRLWQPEAFLSTDPKLPDGPFKRSKRSKCVDIAKLFLGAMGWQAKSFLSYWPETAGCALQTLQALQGWKTAKLSWSCQIIGCGNPRRCFLLTRNCRMVLGLPAKLSLGAAKLWAVATQGVPFY